MLKHHSYPAFASVLSVAPWRIIPSIYIICENDQAIPLVAQEGLINAARILEPGCFDIVERCDAGHYPFISQPEASSIFLVLIELANDSLYSGWLRR